MLCASLLLIRVVTSCWGSALHQQWEALEPLRPSMPVCTCISLRLSGKFMKHLCWETTDFSFGLAPTALEGAMIHVENKKEGASSNLLYYVGMTMAWQLLSFTEGTEAGSVEAHCWGEICSIIFNKSINRWVSSKRSSTQRWINSCTMPCCTYSSFGCVLL